ncbi:MAG: hypothetical protein QOH39_395 [Verrucomicrobiota bacterium]|jgi:hypothetical protein
MSSTAALITNKSVARLDRARSVPVSTWVVLWGIAIASRVAAAVLLPNAEQDGYSYAEAIANLSGRIAGGSFHVTDLFGFWLPLFQFFSAILNLFVHNPIAVGKIVSLLCGASACVLVFALTWEITQNRAYAWLAFALIVLAPLHILYSAACMTDVPHSCMILASLWFALRKQWILAAIFAALAEGLRIEAWALLFVIPAIQFLCERRVSLGVVAILLVPPLTWFAISYLATGDPFAYFADRAQYHAAYMDFHPTRRGFVFSDINQDVSYFLVGANSIVFLSSIAATAVLIWQWITGVDYRGKLGATVIVGYGIGLTGLLVVAYLTKRQPVLLPRYGLACFSLGLPLFAWLLQLAVEKAKWRWLAKSIGIFAVVLSVWVMKPQVPTVAHVVQDFQAHQKIAKDLDASLQSSEISSHCFSDDVAIRVLAHQPPARFLRSQIVPRSASKTADDFERYLRSEHVSHLVFFRTEDSLPVKFYPQLGQNEYQDTGRFELISAARSSFGPDIWLYRLRTAN